MPPKSAKQRSIKDHFNVIPKSENQIEKKEIKMHPLFLSVKQRKQEEREKKTIGLKDNTNILPKVSTSSSLDNPKRDTPVITNPIMNNIKEERDLPKQGIKQIKKQKKTFKKHDPFASIIKEGARDFYSTQKANRRRLHEAMEGKVSTSFKVKHPYYLNVTLIEEKMNAVYKNNWKKEPCCRVLFENLTSLRDMEKAINDNKKLLWSDKYRPNCVEGLVGFLPDYEYIRDWLNRLKIKAPLLSSTPKNKTNSRKKRPCYKDSVMDVDDDENEPLCNLMLFVGKNGLGKTAAVYTAAKETGYSVFEINSSSRRTGKDVTDYVGEMLASHHVQFDGQKKRKIVEGERIIMRDTVIKKKPKTIDIAQHFKKLLHVSQQTEEDEEHENDSKKGEQLKADADQVMTEAVKPNIQNFFKKMEEKNKIKREEETKHEEPKQSLVLLEEVDILFEEDKGFWSAVIELSQKSKRPIIMTCNDESQIPFEHLYLQSIIYFEKPEKASLVPYFQLICYSENYVVDQGDIQYLCELYDYNTRQIIDTLQFWLNERADNGEHFVFHHLFAHVMGFADLITKPKQYTNNLVELMDRLKGLDSKTKHLCRRYYFTTLHNPENSSVEIEEISNIMNTESFTDAYIGLTDQQRHQIYDSDQYDTKDIFYNNTTLLLKEAKDLDHWELGEVIENTISIVCMSQEANNNRWRNDYLSSWSNHWGHLQNESQIYMNTCLEIIHPSILNNFSIELSRNLVMMEYMPEIRSLCIHDKGIAGKGRTKRTRKQIRYFDQLDDESRKYLIQQ
ncbi:MAG: hypothetical protein EXX96DRAFT_570574 [Benjaminiella poitrasii]|nr:MAG: hypothetical protein EXX96DRAFT_570574 [Benjaminiella poitrasii]